MSIMSDVKDSNGYKLTNVEVGFEISGEGGVSFIGTAKVWARLPDNEIHPEIKARRTAA
jgi:hypothetical protein